MVRSRRSCRFLEIGAIVIIYWVHLRYLLRIRLNLGSVDRKVSVFNLMTTLYPAQDAAADVVDVLGLLLLLVPMLLV